MRNGDKHIQQQITQLLQDLNMPELYRSYAWIGDTWEKGFPDLFRLELEISFAARQNAIKRSHLLEIAKWGRLPNIKKISCAEPINLKLYVNNQPADWLETEPENAIMILDKQIRGFGPTYSSKILHFAVPQIYGAIDTRLVRTFGKGDLYSQRYPFLNLIATQSEERWAIPSFQRGWPGEYGTWVRILRSISNCLNEKGISCPHPPKYMQYGLRQKGIWLPADVETALFSFASKVIAGKKQ